MKDKELSDYLLEKYSPQTVKIYLFDIRRYTNYMGEERAVRASYRDIMEYVDYLRKGYRNPLTIKRMLYGVKAWYFYMIEKGERSDHPCRQLQLKDARGADIQLQDLFSSIEMEKLLQREERFEAARLRNRVIISLLIYQGLRLSEIVKLRVKDVDLEAGTIYVRAMPRAMARILKLKINQIMLFYNYIHEVRPRLLRTGTDRLVLTLRGNAENGEGIGYLIETFRPLFPERNLNARTLRQSVITNLLKEGKDLRVVQVFAGHKKISSTEKYRQSGFDELQKAIERYHPLG
jgi:integrase/recombinase XerD